MVALFRFDFKLQQEALGAESAAAAWAAAVQCHASPPPLAPQQPLALRRACAPAAAARCVPHKIAAPPSPILPLFQALYAQPPSRVHR